MAQYARLLGENGMENLTEWVDAGGTLVTMGSSTEMARQADLLPLETWYDQEENEDAQRFTVPGAFFQADVNQVHWLTVGMDGLFPAFVNSIYPP